MRKLLSDGKIAKPSFFIKVNKILALVLAASLVYFCYIFFFTAKKDAAAVFESARVSESASRDKADEGALEIPRIGDLASYSKAVQGRSLFQSPVMEPVSVQKSSGKDLSKKLNLVGILEGDEPQAIIEDMELNKTHYVYKGQAFNGSKVKDIQKGKVILDCDGQEIVLVL